jgi:hypothetical protein
MTMITHSDNAAAAIASMQAMGSGTLADLEALNTADVVNREAVDEPPDARGVGPTAIYATARWLRTAFSDLVWEIHDVVDRGELVAEHWANRDDLGMAEQLGWTPPSPLYLARMVLGRRRARRAAQRS